MKALALTTALILASHAPAGGPLSEAEILALVAGTTVSGIYENGVPFLEMYGHDGSLRYVMARSMLSGRWYVRGGALCTFYDDGSGGCFRIERESENCFAYHELERDAFVAFGWNAAEAPTCRPLTGLSAS